MVTVDGFDFPEDLFYLGGGTDQLWIKTENGKVRIGMTPLGTYAAGKIKFIRLRPPGKEVKAGRSVGTLESGKWTGAVKSPVTGTIIETNEDLKANPGLLNDDPFGKGWIALIEANNWDGEVGALQGINGLEAWAKTEVKEKKALKGE